MKQSGGLFGSLQAGKSGRVPDQVIDVIRDLRWRQRAGHPAGLATHCVPRFPATSCTSRRRLRRNHREATLAQCLHSLSRVSTLQTPERPTADPVQRHRVTVPNRLNQHVAAKLGSPGTVRSCRHPALFEF